jgi:N-acetylglucosaminylphosphatidylinositol deacetylase
MLTPSQIVTFDHTGITQHPNHTPLPKALQLLSLTPSTRVATLKSPNILLKFTGPLYNLYRVNLEILFNVLRDLDKMGLWGPNKLVDLQKRRLSVVLTFSQWVTGWRAMLQHRSQLVWFRWLYLTFSQLMWMNELEVVA